MKTLKILAISMLIFTGTAMAEENHHGAMNHDQHQMEMMDHGQYEHMAEAKSVRQVEASKVCMVNDSVFDRDQIAVEVGGKTSYGCCPMCKDRLNQDASIRKATDPISGAEVDKAAAIIGADESGKVYYFETEENLHKHMGH